MPKPTIGITTDLTARDGRETARVTTLYADMVASAGGIPVLLHHDTHALDDILDLCAGFVLSGGDDPRVEPFGDTTDPRITPVPDRRQTFEAALLERLDEKDRPTLGVCLGMQMMALVAGGSLDQYMPDSTPTAADHWDADHPIESSDPSIESGVVHSRHKQAVRIPGALEVIARAPDGVIEAVRDPRRAWAVGAQWHPERTGEGPLGLGLFKSLVIACR